MTGLLARMEKTGLIKCHRDVQDGRAVRVKLTPLARSVEASCFKLLKDVSAIMQTNMTTVEIHSMKELLARMIDTMRKEEEKARNKT